MRAKKAKALRRAARKIAEQFPDVHSKDTYQNIVRELIEKRTVKIPDRFLAKLGRLFTRKKFVPQTKEIEVVKKRSYQTVLASGPKFILRRLKAAVRRQDLVILPNGQLQTNPVDPLQHVQKIVAKL